MHACRRASTILPRAAHAKRSTVWCARARSLRMLPIELVQVREGAHRLLGILLRVRHLRRLDCARQARAKVSLCVAGVRGPRWGVQARPSRLRLRRMGSPSSWAWRRAWAYCPATCVRSRASAREGVWATAGIRTLVCSGLAGALTSPRIRASKASMSSIASCPSSLSVFSSNWYVSSRDIAVATAVACRR